MTQLLLPMQTQFSSRCIYIMTPHSITLFFYAVPDLRSAVVMNWCNKEAVIFKTPTSFVTATGAYVWKKLRHKSKRGE